MSDIKTLKKTDIKTTPIQGALIGSVLYPLIKIEAPRHPPNVPKHITPGIPKFKCPLFSIKISPVQPKRKTDPIVIALTKRDINKLILFLYLLFRTIDF